MNTDSKRGVLTGGGQRMIDRIADACASLRFLRAGSLRAPNHGRISMIEAFQHHLSTALSRAPRSLDANRHRFVASDAGGASAMMAVPVLATPVLVVARRGVEARAMRSCQEREHVRRYCTTTRL
jgi:hypothetical protein